MNTLVTVDRALGAIFANCTTDETSGVATAVRGKLKRIFCLERGRLTYAASNVIEEQFSETLIRSGLVGASDLAAARVQAEKSGVKLMRLLIDEQVVDEALVDASLDSHLRGLVYSTLDWADGDCSFQRGLPNLEGEIKTDLPSVSLLFDYTEHHPATVDDVRVRVGSPGTRPMVVQERLKLLEATQPAPATLFLLEKADGRLSLDDLLSRSPEPLETTWRALYGLILLGVLRPEIAQTKAADDNTVTRTEMEARLKSADGADYYAILEVNATATTAQIRSAYYFLARRYHPDRFRTGPLRDLLGETEIYFSRVTEAYNTLFDAALRTAYDQQRTSAAPESRQPQHDEAYLAKQNFARARILIDKGRLTDAVTSLQNAIEQDSQQATYHLALGRLLTRNPRMRTQAEEHLITTNRIDPALTDGYVALGELYLKKNRNADAVKLFREALRWEPGHTDATTHLKDLGERVEA